MYRRRTVIEVQQDLRSNVAAWVHDCKYGCLYVFNRIVQQAQVYLRIHVWAFDIWSCHCALLKELLLTNSIVLQMVWSKTVWRLKSQHHYYVLLPHSVRSLLTFPSLSSVQLMATFWLSEWHDMHACMNENFAASDCFNSCDWRAKCHTSTCVRRYLWLPRGKQRNCHARFLNVSGW